MSRPLSHMVYPARSLYGADEPAEDDLAETFHEASKFYPSTAARLTAGGARLERSPELRAAALQAGARNRHLPRTPLRDRLPLTAPLGEVLLARRSRSTFGSRPVELAELATVLHAAYGVTRETETDVGVLRHRTVPSGGALYPLELYVFAAHVTGLAPALYHFDPVASEVERLPAPDAGRRLAEAAVYAGPFAQSAATVMIAASFWRSRFKYGIRSYRFTLLEAGHAMQNLLLAAAACGLSALPVGGFFDQRVDELLGIDGVNESVLYLAHLGSAT